MPNRILTFILGMSIILNLVLLLASDSVVNYVLKKNPISQAKAAVKKTQKDFVSTKLSAAKKKSLVKEFFRPTKKKNDTVTKKKGHDLISRYEELKQSMIVDLSEYLDDKFHRDPEITKKVLKLMKESEERRDKLSDSISREFAKKYGEDNLIYSYPPEATITLGKERQKLRYKMRKLLGRKEFDKLLDWAYFHNQNIALENNSGAWVSF
jgi:hypothetical protein